MPIPKIYYARAELKLVAAPFSNQQRDLLDRLKPHVDGFDVLYDKLKSTGAVLTTTRVCDLPAQQRLVATPLGDIILTWFIGPFTKDRRDDVKDYVEKRANELTNDIYAFDVAQSQLYLSQPNPDYAPLDLYSGNPTENEWTILGVCAEDVPRDELLAMVFDGKLDIMRYPEPDKRVDQVIHDVRREIFPVKADTYGIKLTFDGDAKDALLIRDRIRRFAPNASLTRKRYRHTGTHVVRFTYVRHDERYKELWTIDLKGKQASHDAVYNHVLGLLDAEYKDFSVDKLVIQSVLVND